MSSKTDTIFEFYITFEINKEKRFIINNKQKNSGDYSNHSL